MGISNMTITGISSSGATVAWATDVPSSTELDFGPVDASGNWTSSRLPALGSDTTAHQYPLTGLDPATTYRVQAQSYDDTVSFSYLPCDDGSSPANFSTPAAANNGGTQGPATVGAPSANGVDIAWTSSDPGIGSVNYWKNGDATQLNSAESASSTVHKVSLTDLVGGTQYNFTYQTDFDDPTLPTAVSSPSTFTTAADPVTGPVLPGHLGLSVRPDWLAVGGQATVTAQLLTRLGKPQPGVAIQFLLGVAGNLDGTLSATQAITDAQGLASVVFTATAINGPRRRATRIITVSAGTPPHTVERRAIIFAGAGRRIRPTGR
jgi:hypothetical protein